MELIEWTKGFRVHHERGEFKLFVSKHRGSGFYACLLYYQKRQDPSVSPPQGILEFTVQTEFAPSDQLAIDNIETWMKKSLPGEYSMEPMSRQEVALSKVEPEFSETSEVSDEMPWTKF